jgi:hypothetical protein
MCDIPYVLWTVTPLRSPEPWLHCANCSLPRPFRSSGKVRLNANGKLLDAWLVYNCTSCAKSWNRAIFERRQVKAIDRVLLERDAIKRFEFDLASLRNHTRRVDEFEDIEVAKSGIATSAIRLAVPLPAAIRLDRLLARELGVSRARLSALVGDGLHEALRKRVKDGTRIVFRS